MLDKHFLTSKFQLPKTCQDQRLKVRVNNKKIRVNKLGPSWGPFLERPGKLSGPITYRDG